jgi:hypothetical protein
MRLPWVAQGAAVLRVMGLGEAQRFERHHAVLMPKFYITV